MKVILVDIIFAKVLMLMKVIMKMSMLMLILVLMSNTKMMKKRTMKMSMLMLILMLMSNTKVMKKRMISICNKKYKQTIYKQKSILIFKKTTKIGTIMMMIMNKTMKIILGILKIKKEMKKIGKET